MTEDIRFEYVLYIKASKEQVWEGITNPEKVTQYYMCQAMKIGAQAGEPIEYGAGGEVFIAGEMLEIIPNEKLIHTFQFMGSHEQDAEHEPSKVSYELIPEGELLILVLTHTGFSERNDTFRSVTGGWPYVLSNLKTLLETGKTLR